MISTPSHGCCGIGAMNFRALRNYNCCCGHAVNTGIQLAFVIYQFQKRWRNCGNVRTRSLIDKLDAVGNTTAAIARFAIGSAS